MGLYACTILGLPWKRWLGPPVSGVILRLRWSAAQPCAAAAAGAVVPYRYEPYRYVVYAVM
jgi:hypothetical protein